MLELTLAIYGIDSYAPLGTNIPQSAQVKISIGKLNEDRISAFGNLLSKRRGEGFILTRK